MARYTESTANRSMEFDPKLDEALLDQYAGYYHTGEWNVTTVRREGCHLLIELPAASSMELIPTSECDFDVLGAEPSVTFDRGSGGAVSLLRLRMRGGDMPAERIDAATAEQVRSRLLARTKEAKHIPGSDVAVRRLAESLLKGQPHYGEMHPALAYAMYRRRLSLQILAAHLGATESISFHGVDRAGRDVYDIEHQYGRSCWRIMLHSDGLITDALLQMAGGEIFSGILSNRCASD